MAHSGGGSLVEGLMRIYNLLGYSALACAARVVGLARAALARTVVGDGNRLRVSGDVMVCRRRLSIRRDAHGHYAWGPGLQGVVHQGRHAAEQHPRRLRRSGQLGQSTPVASSICGHHGDPNKLDGDGFWSTLVSLPVSLQDHDEPGRDDILRTWPFRLVSHPLFMAISPVLSCGFLWLFVRDWPFAIAVWLGTRVFALWVNMVQNYWTHDRRWGTRRYADPDDNAMNIGDWLPVMATFSACWQNNHHHYPHLLRTTRGPGEFDFGYMTVRVMGVLGLVKPSATGADQPDDVPLGDGRCSVGLGRVPLERRQQLPEEASRHGAADQAVARRPGVFRQILGPKTAIDEREVDGEVDIHRFRDERRDASGGSARSRSTAPARSSAAGNRCGRTWRGTRRRRDTRPARPARNRTIVIGTRISPRVSRIST